MTNYILIYPGVMLIIINCFGHSGKLLTAQGTGARSTTPSVSFVAARSWGSVERGKLPGGSRRAGGMLLTIQVWNYFYILRTAVIVSEHTDLTLAQY